MSSLILVLSCLGTLSLAFGGQEIQFTKEDKVVIQKMQAYSGAMMFVLMMQPQELMFDILKAVVERKKADPELIEYLEKRLEKEKRKWKRETDVEEAVDEDDYEDEDEDEEDDMKKNRPAHLEYLANMYRTFKSPKLQENRNRLNYWTDGIFDLKKGAYLQTVQDNEKGYVAAVRETLQKLSPGARHAMWKDAETLDRTVKMHEKMEIARRIYNKLTPDTFY